MGTARNAILKAYIEDVLCDLMVKTTGEMVFLDETTTVAAKIAEMVSAINSRAKITDVTAEVNALRQELLGDVPVEAYNTFTELAAYISEHQDAADALTAAIGNKADKETVTAIQAIISGLGALASKNLVTESDLDASLKEKVNAASQGNHSHNNKTLLDGITEDRVASWDGKAKIYIRDSQPSELSSNDLFIRIV